MPWISSLAFSRNALRTQLQQRSSAPHSPVTDARRSRFAQPCRCSTSRSTALDAVLRSNAVAPSSGPRLNCASCLVAQRGSSRSGALAALQGVPPGVQDDHRGIQHVLQHGGLNRLHQVIVEPCKPTLLPIFQLSIPGERHQPHVRLTMDKPIPRPPWVRSSVRSLCTKRSNTYGRSSSVVPVPWSLTVSSPST
jgi:hypothetical protein